MTSTEAGAVLPGTPAGAGAAVGPVVGVPEPLGEPPAGPTVPDDRREVEAARIAPAGTAVSDWMTATAGTSAAVGSPDAASARAAVRELLA